MSKHIHILGVCGTFMAGIAAIAKKKGYHVTGSDQHVYPPMSDFIRSLGIEIFDGQDMAQLQPMPDEVVVGNVISRGHPIIEAVLNQKIPYSSGPEWLKHHILKDKWVLAVSGTHGKTTTSSMLSWILEDCGLNPGFLIGGMCHHFDVSARYTDSPYFVIEADEYDTAFFDKRSKFVHYHPKTLVINNLEYDHADIFSDLAAIQRQFHHLVRTVPSEGLIITQGSILSIQEVLEMGVWTPVEEVVSLNARWQAKLTKADGSRFEVLDQGVGIGEVNWSCIGTHNVQNALSAIAASVHAGVDAREAMQALSRFKGVKRRLEVRSTAKGITIYEDFAHHPTAIKLTLSGLREKVKEERVIAIFEPRSNSMKKGTFKDQFKVVFSDADEILLLQPEGINWQWSDVIDHNNFHVFHSVNDIVSYINAHTKPGGHIAVMSNGSFDGLINKLVDLYR